MDLHEVLIKRIVKLAQEKRVGCRTDYLDITIAVESDVKPQTKHNRLPSGNSDIA